jgi:hypothetical protein
MFPWVYSVHRKLVDIFFNQGKDNVQTSELRFISGVCEFCPRGKYSLVPLAGAKDVWPSCMPCPAGGDCSSGGDSVVFDVGTWGASADGIYRHSALTMQITIVLLQLFQISSGRKP